MTTETRGAASMTDRMKLQLGELAEASSAISDISVALLSLLPVTTNPHARPFMYDAMDAATRALWQVEAVRLLIEEQ